MGTFHLLIVSILCSMINSGTHGASKKENTFILSKTTTFVELRQIKQIKRVKYSGHT